MCRVAAWLAISHASEGGYNVVTIASRRPVGGALSAMHRRIADFVTRPGAWRRALVVVAAAVLFGGAAYAVVQVAVRLGAPFMPAG